MMRLRSSSRCWRRLMEPSSRSANSSRSGSVTRSGIVILGDAALDAFGQAIQSAVKRDIGLVRGLLELAGHRRDMLVGVNGLFELQLPNFLVNLSLKVSAGSLELGHEFAPAAGNFRQTAPAEEDESEQHQKNDLGEAEIHRP